MKISDATMLELEQLAWKAVNTVTFIHREMGDDMPEDIRLEMAYLLELASVLRVLSTQTVSLEELRKLRA